MSDNIHKNFWGGMPEMPWRKEEPTKPPSSPLLEAFDELWFYVEDYDGSEKLLEMFRQLLIDADNEIDDLRFKLGVK